MQSLGWVLSLLDELWFRFCDFLLRILKPFSQPEKSCCLSSLRLWRTRHVSHSKHSRALRVKADLCLLQKSLMYTE